MADPLTLTVSALALAVSSITAWMTLFRRGTIKMTQPTVIFFGPDAPQRHADPPSPKVYLRTLLFSTSKRGHIIESMHISLKRNESQQNFNIWVYGDDKLVRGSGLFVGETGVALNHHFLLPKDGSTYRFTEGHYRLEVYARILGSRKHILLFSQSLEIARNIAVSLSEPETGLYFDWGPDSSRYLPHVQRLPLNPDPEEFLQLLNPPANAE